MLARLAVISGLEVFFQASFCEVYTLEKSTLEKISKIREWAPDIDIEIDGGIKLDNVDLAINAGANVIVAGSAIYGSNDVVECCKEFMKRGIK